MKSKYIDSLLKFMDDSPCNFLAVDAMKRILVENGFKEKSLKEKITAKAGEKFLFFFFFSAIFAVKVGKKPIVETGYAGRVILKGESSLEVVSRNIKINRPLMQISHLAIHFNRAVNEGNPLSKQKDMLPIIAKVNENFETGNMLLNLVAQELGVTIDEIIDFDLLLYDTTPACTFGLNNEFISSGRLDDLSMAHAAITAIVEGADDENTCIAAIFDNEETGSGTKQGAGSPVLANVLQRMAESQGCNFDEYCIALQKTFLISADNAHAHHPNYNEKYDPTNHPTMGSGPCIKINANCKYMSDAHSALRTCAMKLAHLASTLSTTVM